MKNKNFYIFIFALFFISTAFTQENDFTFKTKNIEIDSDKDLINAYFGKAVSNNNNFEILADNFQYFNNLGILNINGNGIILLKEKNLKIKFNKGIIDQKKSTFEASGEIIIEDQNNFLKIETDKIHFNYKDDILFSKTNSTIVDKNQNIFDVEEFNYEIAKGIIKINKLELVDKNKNIMRLSNAYLNIKTNNILGKDAIIELSNKTFNKKNEPRLKGNSVSDDENFLEVTRGVFTTCKKREGCPPWQLVAKKINHDKNKKIISYKDVVLKIYDYPIIYFPKFSHPDPTVNRQSGFLTPSIKRSGNKNSFFEIPYYFVVSENKDFTLSQRLYDNNQFLTQTEYRSVGKKSNLISEISFKIDNFEKLKGHAFYMYEKLFNFKSFVDSSFVLNLQKTSKDTYLEKNKIKSKITSQNNILENSLKLNFLKNDLLVNLETYAYENLNRDESDRYEYILPKINIEKKVFKKTKLDGDFYFQSEIFNNYYNTNVFETFNINNLFFKSSPRVSKKGVYSNYEFLIKNSNTNANNSTTLKNKESGYLSGLFQINSSMPLLKNNDTYSESLNPKLALKISPNYSIDNRKNNNPISLSNIYNIERGAVTNTNVESGMSLTYGSEYAILNKKKSNEVFKIEFANNLRFEKNDDLVRNSQINEKVSSFLNEVSLKPNKFLSLNYNSSIKNNLDDINYEQLITEVKINNLVTSFDYLNDNEHNNNSYIANKTKFNFDDYNSISFSTRKNKDVNLTEYYKLAYQYENDCLSASIEYDKEYYSNNDIKPIEGIFLKFTITPFN
jgi:LPS-assembly protein